MFKNPKKLIKLRLIPAIFILQVSHLVVAQPSSNEVLSIWDSLRGAGGIEFTIDIQSIDNNVINQFTASTKQQGYYSVSVVDKPEEMQGVRIYTSKDKIWYWKPGQKQPLPVTIKQNILGPITFYDVVGINYSGNYEVNLLGQEPLQGRECWSYMMSATNSIMPYPSIKIWLEQEHHLPIQAEYYSASGRKIKVSEMKYENKILEEGILNPYISEIIFYDSIMKNRKVIVKILNPNPVNITDEDFKLKLEK